MIARPALLDAQLVRFALVTVAGLGIDLAVSGLLVFRLGLPLAVGAFCGFITAACCNYVVHERWTFAGGRLSAVRGPLFLALSAGALGVRVGTVVVLQKLVLTGPDQRLLALVISIGASFAFNFMVSRQFVFRRSPSAQQDPAA